MKVCVIGSLFVTLALSFSAQGSVEICGECGPLLKQIESRLIYVVREMNVARENPLTWDRNSFAYTVTESNSDSIPTARGPKSFFMQRLEALATYRASQERLSRIEKDLKELQEDIARDQAALGPNPTPGELANLKNLRRLADIQDLIVAELKFQLAEIQRRFEDLDARIDAQEERIDAVQGGLDQVTDKFREMAKEIHAHRVATETKAFEGIKDFAHGKSQGTPAEMWQVPRTELKLDELDNKHVEVTVGVDGKLFQIVSGEARGGLVFDTVYTTTAYVISPGVDTLLTTNGALTRDSYLFCGASKTFTLKSFGSIEGSAGINAVVVNVKTGVKLERGVSQAGTTTKYSKVVKVSQGQTFEDQMRLCRSFTAEIRETSPPEKELTGMLKLVQLPETVCYKDYDCRDQVQLGMLLSSTVAQCFAAPDREHSICENRLLDTGATCSPDNQPVRNFRLHCAKGYTCDKSQRLCRKNEDGNAILRSKGLAEAKVVSLATTAEIVGVGDQFLYGENYCTQLGHLSFKDGWRLPTREELKAVAHWFRDWSRENLRRTYPWPKISAQQWFYPREAYSGLLWSEGQWVQLLSNDSAASFAPADPKTRETFADPKTGALPSGVAICVRPIK